jgi:hypothetical protein
MNENETPRQIDKRTSVEKQAEKKQRPETLRIVKSSCGRVCWILFVCVCVCDVEMMKYLEAARCIIWGIVRLHRVLLYIVIPTTYREALKKLSILYIDFILY